MQISGRIDGLTADADFVVNVGTGAKTGAAHVGDELTGADAFAGNDYDLHSVGVSGDDAAVVNDVDHVAVAVGVPTGVVNNAVGGGDYGSAKVIGYVNAGMEVGAAPTIAVRGSDNAGSGPKRRNSVCGTGKWNAAVVACHFKCA